MIYKLAVAAFATILSINSYADENFNGIGFGLNVGYDQLETSFNRDNPGITYRRLGGHGANTDFSLGYAYRNGGMFLGLDFNGSISSVFTKSSVLDGTAFPNSGYKVRLKNPRKYGISFLVGAIINNTDLWHIFVGTQNTRWKLEHEDVTAGQKEFVTKRISSVPIGMGYTKALNKYIAAGFKYTINYHRQWRQDSVLLNSSNTKFQIKPLVTTIALSLKFYSN